MRYLTTAHGLLLWLVLCLLLLAAVLRAPAGWQLDIGMAGDATRLANFHAPEQQEKTRFRWSGPGARLLLAGLRPLPHELTLRLNSEALHQADAPMLHLEQDGQPIAAFETAPSWRTYHVLLPPAALAAPADQAALALASHLHYPGAHDGRYLGVPLSDAALSPLNPAPAHARANAVHALVQAGLLLSPLATLALLLWPRAAVPTAPWPRLRRVGSFVLLGGGTLGLLRWAQHDPAALAHTAQALLALLPWLLVLVLLWRTSWYAGLTWLLTRLRPASWLGVTALAALLAHVLLLAAPWLALRGVAALALLLLPGALLALLLRPPAADTAALPEAPAPGLTPLFLALCGGLAFYPLLILLLLPLPGVLSGWLLLLLCDLVSMAAGLALWRRYRHAAPPTLPMASDRLLLHARLLGTLLLLGAALRLPWLGSAEFQGDEGLAMLAAADIARGTGEALLLRPKGPVEALVPAGLLLLTGQINEGLARLPFALAGLGILLGAYLLGRQLCAGLRAAPWFGAAVGLLAAAVLALDGFLIAYARIVQYQSIVLLMACGAIWCGWRFYRGAAQAGTAQPWRYLLGAAVLSAAGMLAHYDGIFVAPLLAWLVLAGGWRRGWRPVQWVSYLGPPVLLGLLLVAGFYGTLVQHEQFQQQSAGYLAWRLGQTSPGGPPFNNLPGYYAQATFYNTTFQINVLAGLLLAALLGWLLYYGRPRWLGAGLAGLLLLGSLLLVAAPEVFAVGASWNWALLPFGLPLLGLLLAPATPAALRALLLWFAAPFVAMAFFIAVPNTHFYTLDAAAALLVALALAQLLAWSSAQPWGGLLRGLLALAGAVLLLLAVPYMYLVYLRQYPEYQRSFPAARPAIYRASYGDALPDGGYFGFPHRDGWKVAGELYRRGVLEGVYASNQKARMTTWYLPEATRCGAAPAYYLLARGQSYVVPAGYHLWGYVLVEQQRALDIYSSEPPAQGPRGFALADVAAAFDQRRVPAFSLEHIQYAFAPDGAQECR
jgi:hypothetical protein